MRHRAQVVAGLITMVLTGCGRDGPMVGLVETSEASSSGTGGSSSSSSDESSSESSSSDGEAGASGTDSSGSTGTGVEESSTTESETEGVAPFCGDGKVDREKGEECDDGEGISETCVLCGKVRLIFLTSTLLQGGKINGLMGADAYCRSLALKAKMEVANSPITEPANFKALLSTSTETIADRHFYGKGPYRLVNGLQVSRNFNGLFTEALENPINVDERSETLHAPVWTGTNVDGSPYPGINFCGDWKDLQGTANWGDSDEIDSGWVHLENDLNPDSDCYSGRPIYCVEQE